MWGITGTQNRPGTEFLQTCWWEKKKKTWRSVEYNRGQQGHTKFELIPVIYFGFNHCWFFLQKKSFTFFFLVQSHINNNRVEPKSLSTKNWINLQPCELSIWFIYSILKFLKQGDIIPKSTIFIKLLNWIWSHIQTAVSVCTASTLTNTSLRTCCFYLYVSLWLCKLLQDIKLGSQTLSQSIRQLVIQSTGYSSSQSVTQSDNKVVSQSVNTVGQSYSQSFC